MIALKLAFSNLAAPDWSLERALAAVREYGSGPVLSNGSPCDRTLPLFRALEALSADEAPDMRVALDAITESRRLIPR
jgi:hypothetical protein